MKGEGEGEALETVQGRGFRIDIPLTWNNYNCWHGREGPMRLGVELALVTMSKEILDCGET